jgi:putative flippase GtrA
MPLRALVVTSIRVAHPASACRPLVTPAFARFGGVGQGLRYAIAGTTVALWYLVTTIVLADVLDVAFQLALAIGFVTAVLVHFTLQRFFVWAHHSEFALGLGAQVGRYLAIAGVQYAVRPLSPRCCPAR